MLPGGNKDDELPIVGPDDWLTNDGRVIPIDEMDEAHVKAALNKISPWSKFEQDPGRRQDLKAWRRKFRKELRRRSKDR